MELTDSTRIGKKMEERQMGERATNSDLANQPTTGASLCSVELGGQNLESKAKEHSSPANGARRVAFGLSRYVVLVAYSMYCLLSGPSFMNWTTIADSLYKSGAFEWECQPADIDLTVLAHEPKCGQQEISVNHLFTVASCSYFVFAMLGGIMLDFAGPKFGAFSGLACLILGWTLFGLSCQSFQAYVPAAVLMGAGIDMAFFPCLCAANLFPGKGATVIAILGSFRSISFVVGLTLRTIYMNVAGTTFRGVMLGFVGFGLGLCLLVAVFIIPRKAWTEAPSNANSDRDVEAGAASSSTSADKLTTVQSMKRDFLSPSFLPLFPYFVLVLIVILFFAPSAKRLIPSAYEANQIISIFSFVPCIILGWVTDRVGIVPVMMICNGCGLLSWILMLIPGIPCYEPSQFIVSILISIQMSFLVSQIYCYIAEVFQPENMGKMIGFLCSVGGMISLVTDPMRKYSVDNGFFSMTLLCLIFAAINQGLLAIMYLRKKKVPKVL